MFDFLILIVTNPVEVAGGNPVSGLAGQFGVEWKLLIAQIINFGLVTFLLYRFAFKPVLNTLEERQKRIADGLQYTEEMELKLKDAEREHTELIKQATLEGKAIIDAAHEQAKNHMERQTREAATRAEETIKKAEVAIAQEKQKMIHDARKELAQLVVSVSSKVLSKNLSTEEQSRFTESAVKELTLKI